MDIMFEKETTAVKKTSTEVTMVTKMIKVDPMFHFNIGNLLLGMIEVIWRELKICYKR